MKRGLVSGGENCGRFSGNLKMPPVVFATHNRYNHPMNFKEKMKMLFQLYFAFAKVGSITFGGGLAMMPMLQRELGDKRGWITDEDLIDYYAIGQSTPGIVAVNVATFVGFKQAGILGGIFATFGIVTPSLIIIMILASLISSIEGYPLVQKALAGVNVAVAALLSKVAYNFSKKTIKNVFSVCIALVSFVLVGILKIQSFYIILGAIALGSVLHFHHNRGVKKGSGNVATGLGVSGCDSAAGGESFGSDASGCGADSNGDAGTRGEEK